MGALQRLKIILPENLDSWSISTGYLKNPVKFIKVSLSETCQPTSTGHRHFPHLLLLIDDPSEVVRSEVRKALLPLASEIAELLKIFPATPEQLQELQRMLFPWRKSQLLSAWPRWRSISHPLERLEAFHSLLCEFEFRWTQSVGLSQQIDDLLRDLDQTTACSGNELPARLFAERLRGNRDDYYNPANSYLSEVLRSGQGNPISLCCLLMLVGRRLGLDYRGCSFPGHFLARFEGPEGLVLFDCFAGGRALGPELTEELRGELPMVTVRELVRKSALVEEIAARVLRNLAAAYVRLENREYACLFDLLLKDLVARGKGQGAGVALREPLFVPGQVVRHRRKQYRGVVIDYDLYCEQEGQPHLPFYRVLVHGSPHVASAHEGEIELDSGGLVAHQLVSVFFTRFENGMYVRNSRPWEGSG
jgi:heat shock protein HspQ